VQQSLLDAQEEARHLAAQVAGRDDHLLHLERRVTEAKAAAQDKDKQLSALLASRDDTGDDGRCRYSPVPAGRTRFDVFALSTSIVSVHDGTFGAAECCLFNMATHSKSYYSRLR
jgi:hypothetical protein